ncbi:MAG: YafY family transcriptional regulator [Kouleothrix sp.]|nr:YafY family transcriptional regulator [Kouleothrix sp.]
MYHPTARVLTVLELLQAHQKLSGPELAARLEVDARTVRRYILLLQDMGIPIEAELGRDGGYRLRPGFKLPPLMFSEDEALALTVGLLAARRLGLASAAPAVEGALAKVERVMPATLRARIQAVQQTLIFDGPSLYSAPSSATVLTFSMAAQRRLRVQLRYRAWGDRETERAIDTYGVVYYDGRWFAVGYCHLRAGLRMFRLDRVLAAELCEGGFERPDDFDCLGFVVHSLATAPGAWLVEALLETTLEQARERVPAAMATLDQLPEGVLLRCHAQNLDWIARFLAGLGFPMIVRQPPELRDALRALAAEIAAIAER